MKITQLTLGGFKGVSRKVTIPIAPITLLFGANSTGKSTVLHSLLYLYEVLANGNVNPEFSTLTGRRVRLGGFESLVHEKDKSRSITIGMSLDFTESQEYWDDYISEGEAFLLESAIDGLPDSTCDKWSFELEIAWSQLEEKPYIKRYQVFSDGDSYCRVDYQTGAPQAVISQFKLLSHWGILDSVEVVSQWEDPSNWQPVHIKTGRSALPNIYSRINFSSSVLDTEEICPEHPLAGRIFLEGCASQTLLAPLKILCKKLQKLFHIGPLRIIPDLTFTSQTSTSNHDWFDGSGAWSEFINANASVKQQVNDWLSTDKGFACNYVLNTSEDDFGRAIPFLKDTVTNTKLSFDQVGVGLSQVIPFVIGCADSSVSVLSCEQPELHIHPKWQLALADILIESTSKDPDRLFFVETHSEHLMLRLLNRVRLAPGDDQYVAELRASPKDISVVNVYRHEEALYYQQQKITSEGDFELDWPEGFFEERYGE